MKLPSTSGRRPPRRVPPPPRRTTAERAAAAALMKILRAGGDARESKIDRVRQSVDQQTYENDLKLSIAVDRMSQDLP
jgi:hypothetical protein